jgi:acetoin utilization deacetylase AcuC-like enzyme
MLPIIYSDEFLLHQTGRYHPERPERLKAIVKTLKAAPWAEQLEWRSPTPIDQRDPMAALEQVHDPAYIKTIQNLAAQGGGYLDPDTVVSPHSYQVALLAVNAWLDGVEQVLTTGNPVFALVRPPGHHALPSQGMGFCLFSNAAIAATYALVQPGIERVAILDWDVHHGNGTQAIVESDTRISYCSLHQAHGYPGTGAADQRGTNGNVLNLPMLAGSTCKDYEQRFREQVIPFLANFRPDLLIVSAGYDANRDDPLAQMALQPEDYRLFTKYCLQLTNRVLFGLEGGYDLPSLAQSVQATLEGCLMHQQSGEQPLHT